MYSFSRIVICFLTGYLLFTLIYILADNQSTSPQGNLNSQPKIGLFEEWHKCVVEKLKPIEDHKKFWSEFKGTASACDKQANIDQLNAVTLKNKDEKKYAILPQGPTTNSSNRFITLGIGNDIQAEMALREKMTENGHIMHFYGADPITDNNQKLYSTIGLYFPFAVSGHSGFSTASVLFEKKYQNMNVVHLDLVYFLTIMLKLRTIDHLWMDAEYAEYELFDIFYKGGSFDQNSITFCQISIEIHRPDDTKKIKFMKFIKHLLEDKRFGFFKVENVGHMRLWLFNFESPYCVSKFLPPSLTTI